MSGIAGIYHLDGRPVEQTDIQRMLDSIAHRGPDGSGVWINGSVGLGHRMLWTTPESLHEKLPLTNKSGDLTITADARIDNRDELISNLSLNGRPRETITDSEIILAAYEKWGEKCPEKLLGDFSFAIWDKRRQRLYCARDPIGIRPFFYYFDGKTFYWGSEPRAIYEDSKISKEPNLQLICLYLLNRFDEREETLYKNIYRLPGSQYMVLQNGEIRKDQYWDIDPHYSIRYKTDEQYAEHFLSLFKDCVKTCLRSNGPVGAMLSGGLDSSSIVCTAQFMFQENSIRNKGFETFSLVFEELPCDERLYINEAVKKWDVKANYFTYEKYLSCLDLQQMEKYIDVAYFPTLISYAPLFNSAQRKGIKIMLHGVGGDDLLLGDCDHLTDYIRKKEIRKLIRQFKYDATISSDSSFSLLLRYCIRPFLPQPIKNGIRFLLKPVRRNGIGSLINNNWLRNNPVSRSLSKPIARKHFRTLTQERTYNGLFFGWNPTISMQMLEQFVSYFMIENRYPFFDRRLIEFSIALPEEQRWQDQWQKKILRAGMNGILPNLISNRKDKIEFSSIIDHEFGKRQHQDIKELIDTSILGRIGIIRPNQFRVLYANYAKRKKKDWKERHLLETAVWLELQCRSIFN